MDLEFKLLFFLVVLAFAIIICSVSYSFINYKKPTFTLSTGEVVTCDYHHGYGSYDLYNCNDGKNRYNVTNFTANRVLN